jgi:hypothetical protein
LRREFVLEGQAAIAHDLVAEFSIFQHELVFEYGLFFAIFLIWLLNHFQLDLDHELSPFVDNAAHGNLASHLLNQVLADAQTKPCPLYVHFLVLFKL